MAFTPLSEFCRNVELASGEVAGVEVFLTELKTLRAWKQHTWEVRTDVAEVASRVGFLDYSFGWFFVTYGNRNKSFEDPTEALTFMLKRAGKLVA